MIDTEEVVKIIFDSTTDERITRKDLIRLTLSYVRPLLEESEAKVLYLTGLLIKPQMVQYMQWLSDREHGMDEVVQCRGQ